jgi:hypothetical protein
MMTPAHCDKSPLKEITLRTKEKQLLQGRYANQHVWSAVVISQYRNWSFFLFLLFPFSHFSQMHKATHFVVLGHIWVKK